MNRIKLALVFTPLFLSSLIALSPTTVLAQNENGSGSTGSGNPNAGAINLGDIPGADREVGQVIERAISLFLTLIALLAFINLIYSGMMYISAGGDASKAEKARKNIGWSVLGIVIATLSYVLIRFAADPQDLSSGQTNQQQVQSLSGGRQTEQNAAIIEISSKRGALEKEIRDRRAPANYMYEIKLTSAPTEDIVINLSLEGSLIGSLGFNTPTTLTFTPENWDTPKMFGVFYTGGGQPGQRGRVVIKSTQLQSQRYIHLTLVEDPLDPGEGGSQ